MFYDSICLIRMRFRLPKPSGLGYIQVINHSLAVGIFSFWDIPHALGLNIPIVLFPSKTHTMSFTSSKFIISSMNLDLGITESWSRHVWIRIWRTCACNGRLRFVWEEYTNVTTSNLYFIIIYSVCIHIPCSTFLLFIYMTGNRLFFFNVK